MGRKQASGGSARMERLLGNLLDGSGDGVFAFDLDFRLTIWNSVMEGLFGVPRAQALGRNIFDAFPFLQVTGEDRTLQDVLLGRTLNVKDRPYNVPETGRKGAFEGTYSPICEESGRVVGGLAIIRPMKGAAAPRGAQETPESRDSDRRLKELAAELSNAKEALLAEISQRAESQRRQDAHFAATRILAESLLAGEALARLLQAVCEGLAWDAAELWLCEGQEPMLRWEALWHAPDLDLKSFEKASWPLNFRPGDGVPGRVLKSGEPVWIADLEADEEFERGPAAARAGLRRACAVPVQGSGGILGALVFFGCEPQAQDEEALRSLCDIGLQYGLFLERRRAEECRDRFLALTGELFLAAGFDGCLRQLNRTWEDALGLPAAELRGRLFLDLLHADDRARASAELRRLMDGEGALAFEARCLAKDGSSRRVRWTASASLEDRLIYAAGRLLD